MLNIGSINAYSGESNLLAYSISKGALMTLSRNLADALCYDKIRVNHFNVGWVLTPNEIQDEDRRRLAAGLARARRAAICAVGQDHAAGEDRRGGRVLAVRRKPADQRQRGRAGAVSDDRPQSGEEGRLMPRLAAFPKAYMDALCVDGTMTLREWIELGARRSTRRPGVLHRLSRAAEAGRSWASFGASRPITDWRFRCSAARPTSRIPMPRFASEQIDQQKKAGSTCVPSWAASIAACSAASGGRKLSREDGLRYAAESIDACLPHAAACGVTLILENHYKDNYWTVSRVRSDRWTTSASWSIASSRRTSASITIPATRSWPATIRSSCCGA